MVAVLCEHRKEWGEIFEYLKDIKFSEMTVEPDGVYDNFWFNENTNFGCYKFVRYNTHHGIILPYTMKSYY
jgi:hypothetical protein